MCLDINECINDPCLPNESCYNNVGSFRCTPKICDRGFRKNIFGECEDIDECQTHKDRRCSHGKCINTRGSYECLCDKGFKKDERDFRVCRDINECSEIEDICEQSCLNNIGSYRCGCKFGYELNSDNRTCSDVNECSKYGQSVCPGTCHNTIGSYRCGCPSGFRLEDKKYCRGNKFFFFLECNIFNNFLFCLFVLDINECAENKEICPMKDQCLNIHGSYKCMPKECDDDYEYIGSKDYCRRLDVYCDRKHSKPDCEKTPFSYRFIFGVIRPNTKIPYDGLVIAFFNKTVPILDEYDSMLKFKRADGPIKKKLADEKSIR